MSDIGFDQRIAGIEDGMMDALGVLAIQQGGYAKTIASYGGELDIAQLRQALNELTPRMPMFLVSYGDGKDTEDPKTVPFGGAPRHYRHDCTFTVICCSGDARGDKARRRGVALSPGVYKMIEDARRILGGLKFFTTINGEKIFFNNEPLRYADVEYLARLPELTAYAVHFDTWFRFGEPDRTTPGQLVQELVFDVENELELGTPPNLPGVVAR